MEHQPLYQILIYLYYSSMHLTISLLKLNLKTADLLAGTVGRVLSKDDLAALLPEGLKTEESVTQLEAEGAKNLAALCKHTLSM